MRQYCSERIILIYLLTAVTADNKHQMPPGFFGGRNSTPKRKGGERMEVNGVYACTVKEINERFEISTNTIYTLIKSHQISAEKVNNSYLIPLTETNVKRLNRAEEYSRTIKKYQKENEQNEQ